MEEKRRQYNLQSSRESRGAVLNMARRPRKSSGLGRTLGRVGPKAECLAYIKEVWTDMRPLSLRKKMGERARKA